MHDDAEVDQVFGENGKDWLVMNITGGTATDTSDAEKHDTVTDLV